MSSLSITLIDVGWGDSIFIESRDNNNQSHYALIDSNDTTYYRSSYIFLKKLFEKKAVRIPQDKPIFDFVLLSHAHTDHGQGLKAVLKAFGARHFWYPKSLNWSGLANLIRYANRSKVNVRHHQSIDNTKILPQMGDVDLEILWPPRDQIDLVNENNNSVVLILRLNGISFVLTGDAEEDVWHQIAHKIPTGTRFFKVPHHGSVNGTFDQAGNTPWFNICPSNALLGISSHVRPFSHPHHRVINLFTNRDYYRTDEDYHVTFTTDGSGINVKYSHI